MQGAEMIAMVLSPAVKSRCGVRTVLRPDVRCAVVGVRERFENMVEFRMGQGNNAVGFYIVFLTLLCDFSVTLCRTLKTACVRGSENRPFQAISVIPFTSRVDKVLLWVFGVAVRIFKPEYFNNGIFPKRAIYNYASLVNLRDSRFLIFEPLRRHEVIYKGIQNYNASARKNVKMFDNMILSELPLQQKSDVTTHAQAAAERNISSVV